MRRTILVALTIIGVLLGGAALRQGWFRSSSVVVQGSTNPAVTRLDTVVGNSALTGEVAVVRPSTGEPEKPRPVEEIVGIGAALNWDRENDCPRIVDVIPNSPAAAGGLMRGWLISKIDGEPTAGLKLHGCIERLRGGIGSKVRLELVHIEDQATNQVELVRQKIRI